MSELYLDTEFNGFGGELISIALVNYHSSFYEVLKTDTELEPWVAENVIPILGRTPISKEELKSRLFRFLKAFDNPTIYADWYTDLVHFFELFSGSDHATSMDYGCRAVLLHNVPNLEHEGKHNALCDAYALCRWHNPRPEKGTPDEA